MQTVNSTTKKLTKQLIDINDSSSLDGISIIDCQVSGPSGERTIPKELVNINGIQAKSKSLKGTKISWFPQDKLTFVNTISRGARSVLNKYGVTYGSYKLIPASREDDVLKELADLEAQYESEVNNVIANFDEFIEEHKNEDENAEIASLIDDYKLTLDDFQARFKFKRFAPMMFQPKVEADSEEVVKDVSQSLYEEIAKAADTIFQKSIVGRDKLSCRIVSSLSNIYNKMASLAWLDEGIVNILSEYRELILKLPHNGGIEGDLKNQVSYMVVLMSDAEKLKQFGQGKLPGYVAEEEPEDDEDDVASTLMIQRAQQQAPIKTEVIDDDTSFDLADAW